MRDRVYLALVVWPAYSQSRPFLLSPSFNSKLAHQSRTGPVSPSMANLLKNVANSLSGLASQFELLTAVAAE